MNKWGLPQPFIVTDPWNNTMLVVPHQISSLLLLLREQKAHKYNYRLLHLLSSPRFLSFACNSFPSCPVLSCPPPFLYSCLSSSVLLLPKFRARSPSVNFLVSRAKLRIQLSGPAVHPPPLILLPPPLVRAFPITEACLASPRPDLSRAMITPRLWVWSFKSWSVDRNCHV